jgi:hypothetical protein
MASATYGNGLFVAVAGSGAGSGTHLVMASTNGTTWPWTIQSASEASHWMSVTYGNELFVAVAQYGTNSENVRVMASPDGTTWTAQSAPEANSNEWFSVTYGNGLFVAVAWSPVAQYGSGTNLVGITWTSQSASEPNGWRSVTHGNGLFVAVAYTYSGTNPAYMSGMQTTFGVMTGGINLCPSGHNTPSPSCLPSSPITYLSRRLCPSRESMPRERAPVCPSCATLLCSPRQMRCVK